LTTLIKEGKTYNHLGILANPDTLALHNLDVVETAENLVLDLESSDHGELGTLLDLEGLILEGELAAGLGQIDSDGIAAGALHGQGEDDAYSRIVGIGEVLAATETERFLVFLEGFVVGICRRVSKMGTRVFGSRSGWKGHHGCLRAGHLHPHPER